MRAPTSSHMSCRALVSAFTARRSTFPAYPCVAADLALAFIDLLHPLLASLLSRALSSPPSEVALLDTLHPPITGIGKPLRYSVVRTRVLLKLYENLGLMFAQTTIQIFWWDERMMTSGEIDVAFPFVLQLRCTHDAVPSFCQQTVTRTTDTRSFLTAVQAPFFATCFVVLCVINWR